MVKSGNFIEAKLEAAERTTQAEAAVSASRQYLDRKSPAVPMTPTAVLKWSEK